MRKRAILIADDVESNRKILAAMVESLGYSSFQASDGLRGLHAVEDNPGLAAVITDCQMPNMDGETLIRELRKREASASLPILVYSSYLTIKEVSSLLDRGATAFLPFPPAKEDVAEYLGRYAGHPLADPGARK